MRVLHVLIACSIVLAVSGVAVPVYSQTSVSEKHSVAQYNVTWSSLGNDEKDSMPLGNGDVAANVWTEQNGDIVLLVAKSDAYTELGKLVKLGRVRLHFAPPQVFSASQPFTQALRVDRSDIEMASGGNTVRVWIDANHPALHVEVRVDKPTTMTAALETWRTTHSLHGASAEKAGMMELGSDDYPVEFTADNIVPGSQDAVTWYHFNEKSIYPTVLQQEHMKEAAGKYPDPLLHRCFGALMRGRGLAPVDEKTLRSRQAKDLRLDLVALTEAPAASPQQWLQEIQALANESTPADLSALWSAHLDWWNRFWNRSWIDVTGDEQARQVSQGYAMQRYMMAASSRGELPVKFNGGLFTVGHDMADGTASSNADHNPDYRAWGNSYWNQNNRLLYWPLIATGDYDLMQPWFNMYLRALPLAKQRTKLYYHHDGASFPETMFFWGLPNVHDFGWNNPTDEIESRWQRYHIQGGLEVIAQMLDFYDATGDENFARKSLVPFADEIVTFYDQHYPRGSDNKLVMVPAQSLETYQLGAVTPTPDLAGLNSVLLRMIALPANLANTEQIAAWQKLLNSLPEITVGRTTANGKTPPMGVGDPHGKAVILPAAQYGKTANEENPELYVAFPYHLFGVDKPDLQVALDTYAARRFPQYTCWGQDGTEAAALGITDEARKAAVSEFTNYGDQRFQWFWKPAHDWIPDLDNGGSGMITLEEMLLQNDGRKILLTPAWPKDWTAGFRLHALFNTTVEGHVEGGKLTRLEVTPKDRQKDVVIR